jgi:hypothetical protein
MAKSLGAKDSDRAGLGSVVCSGSGTTSTLGIVSFLGLFAAGVGGAGVLAVAFGFWKSEGEEK